MSQQPWGVFVAGTNTEVGKTHVGAMIARQLTGAGLRVGVYKPVASGCMRRGDGLLSEDAETLWEAAGRPGTLAQVCPQLYEAPVAPPVAARLEGREVDRRLLRSGLDAWRASSDAVVVEGVGGLLSPVTDDVTNAHLAASLGLPLVVVAANELGVINGTLQTLVTAAAFRPSLPIAGVVLNQAWANPDDVSLGSNADELRRRCGGIHLLSVGYNAGGFPEPVDWQRLAAEAIAHNPNEFFA